MLNFSLYTNTILICFWKSFLIYITLLATVDPFNFKKVDISMSICERYGQFMLEQ